QRHPRLARTPALHPGLQPLAQDDGGRGRAYRAGPRSHGEPRRLCGDGDRSAARLCHRHAFSRRRADPRVARRRARALASGPPHRTRDPHPRSQDRRSGTSGGTALGVLLYRLARQLPHARKAPAAPPGAWLHGGRLRAHPRSGRALDRGQVAGGDRRVDPGADHASAARERSQGEGQGAGMIFGELAIDEAEGAILAHSLRVGTTTFKKGRKLSAADLAVLKTAGLERVVAARIEPGEVSEDKTAAAVAEAAAGPNLSLSPAFTGRCNLSAEVRGLAVIDRARIDALNLVDEAVTIATLTPFEVVEPRQMVATVK